MSKKSRPGILCCECGARIDRSEYYTHRCECEQKIAENRAEQKAAETRRTVEHNLRVMEQAMIEWDYA